MWISRLKLENIRSFDQVSDVIFSKGINILVGPNNSGKSTVLQAILGLQQPSLGPTDVSILQETGTITVFFRDPGRLIPPAGENNPRTGIDSVLFTYRRSDQTISSFFNNSSSNQQPQTFTQISNREPDNAFYPYLSKRKAVSFKEEIRAEHSSLVTGNLENLYNKIDQISNRDFQPAHDRYRIACDDILGFSVSTTQSANGKCAVYIVRNRASIPLTSMGEGVSNILGLIVDLCVAENQIFIIEEIENDIHPKALKALLALVAEKAEKNQFFISTHSNIVTKMLGSMSESKVFGVKMQFDGNLRVPRSSVVEVDDSPAARLHVLEELGYEPFDFGHWKAWLFLEESSAEVIIRDFLIPTFIEPLASSLRTYSARCLDEVGPKFQDFNNLFVFVHLDTQYLNKAWVLVDAGEKETQLIDRLRLVYGRSGWNPNNFLQFSQHDFERYYPERFQEDVEACLREPDRKRKKEMKKTLLDSVKDWIQVNPDEAKEAFKNSASEVIEILKAINKAIA